MAEDGEVLVAVGELAAVVLAEDGALRADVGAVAEPGDVFVPGGGELAGWSGMVFFWEGGRGPGGEVLGGVFDVAEVDCLEAHC